MGGGQRGERVYSMEGREIKKASTFTRLRPLHISVNVAGEQSSGGGLLGEGGNFLNCFAAPFCLGGDNARKCVVV